MKQHAIREPFYQSHTSWPHMPPIPHRLTIVGDFNSHHRHRRRQNRRLARRLHQSRHHSRTDQGPPHPRQRSTSLGSHETRHLTDQLHGNIPPCRTGSLHRKTTHHHSHYLGNYRLLVFCALGQALRMPDYHPCQSLSHASYYRRSSFAYQSP